MQTQQLIPLARLRPGKNPREYFDSGEMFELEESVRQCGVMQPLLVRPIEDSEDFEIVAGERRWRAAQAAGLAEVPVLVRQMSDAQAEAAAIIENVQRANLSVAEEAKGAKRLLYRNKSDKGETARQLAWSLDKLERRLALTACTAPVLTRAHRAQDPARPRRTAGRGAARHPGHGAQGHRRAQRSGLGAQGAVGQVRPHARGARSSIPPSAPPARTTRRSRRGCSANRSERGTASIRRTSTNSPRRRSKRRRRR